MSFNLIVTCVSKKKATGKYPSIVDPSIKSDIPEKVFSQWQQLVSESKLPSKRAIDLYNGPLWKSFLNSWKLLNSSDFKSHLWVLSAGYGFIGGEEKIKPYDITFQSGGADVPSVLSKFSNSHKTNQRKQSLQKWWDLLSKSNPSNPHSINSLISKAKKDDYFLIVLGKDYLDAVSKDLNKAIKNTKYPSHILVVSNNPKDTASKKLGSNWLYADGRFVNLKGSNSTLVNAKVANKVIEKIIVDKKENSKFWSAKTLNSYLKKLADELPDVEKFNRTPGSDKEVKEYIKSQLLISDIPFSKLHRAYRDSNRACEYTRFRGLYNEVKNQLRKEVQSRRPKFKVKHKSRKTKMKFFLPDWDDRVDPLYDFENDEPTPNREPYEHDAYHYELYGELSCDGILVSKSVLEDNSKKKELANQIGIHKYLRLPRNVPVIGDCGAFSYIAEKNPPFDTKEILRYYQDLDFDLGVSIDHLIVPGILMKKRYLRHDGKKWVQIKDSEFEKMKGKNNVSLVSSKGQIKQRNLFDNSEFILEEEHIDEKERNRRYDLTIKNAKDFIQGHKKGNFTFTPIGAAQGWDPDSYAECVKNYQKIGYTYIALGGLVRSTTQEILNTLEAIAKIRNKKTILHVFGVARLEAIEKFMGLGVASVDSAGMLRQAWLSSSSNYYSPDMNHYTAIRVPPSENKAKSCAKRNISLKTLVKKEKECLTNLRKYDEGKVSLTKTLSSVMTYDEITGGNGKLEESYRRTLLDKPWQSCPCRICKDTGIDIVIFRRNNRNRRRGFHNTWVYFNKLGEI